MTRIHLTRQAAAAVVILAIAVAGAGYYAVTQRGGTSTTGPPPLTSGGLGNMTFPDGTMAMISPGNTSTSISAAIGENLTFQFSSNAGSTGYDWNVSTSQGIEYLNYTLVSTSANPGGPQVRDYDFRALQSGNQSIVMQDVRQFAPYNVTATVTIQVLVSAEPTMLSYNFQVNATEGSLFVVLKNYGNANLSFAQVSVDSVPVAQKSLSIGPGCGDFVPGTECSFTVTYGPNQDLPVSGTTHTLEVVTYSAVGFSYSVTAGQTYHAECTYTSSC